MISPIPPPLEACDQKYGTTTNGELINGLMQRIRGNDFTRIRRYDAFSIKHDAQRVRSKPTDQRRPISAVQSAPTDDFLASNPANAWRLLHERSVGPRSKSRESGLYFTGHLAAQRPQTNRVDEHRSLTMGQPLLLAALTM